jgi:uncharacterized membrane protein
MSILKEVLQDLIGMFLADARLSAAILILVLVVAGLMKLAGLAPLAAGVFLLAGCLALVVISVVCAARAAR